MYYSSAAQSVVTSYYIGWFIGSIIWGIIWGCATNAIIHNKGYDENWFWWGFFFSIIAVIVAATKPEKRRYDGSRGNDNEFYPSQPTYRPTPSIAASPTEQSSPVGQDKWRCSCGKINHNYFTICACGRARTDIPQKKTEETLQKNKEDTIEKPEEKRETEIKNLEPQSKASSVVAEIREYKTLLDEGIISQEEFDAKKKQLLGL